MRSKAQIASIGQETPTVRTFTLEVSREFRFLPGQWVDCYAEVEGSLQVAGYSMTSSPTRTGMIELAVKNVGDNPVTHYLHHDAEVGDTLYVEGGHGDFFFNGGVADSLVLIGGGIGLTPLMSMLSYVDEAAPEIEVLLLHSARAPEELLFRGRIEAVERRNPRVRAVFTVTGPPPKGWSGRMGRIDRDDMFRRGLRAITPNGILGDARGANPQIGDAVLERLAEHLATVVRHHPR